MKLRAGCIIVLLLILMPPTGCRPKTHPERPPYTASDLAQIANILEVAMAPAGDEIAYVSDQSGERELWTASNTGHGWQSRQRILSPGMRERTGLWTQFGACLLCRSRRRRAQRSLAAAQMPMPRNSLPKRQQPRTARVFRRMAACSPMSPIPTTVTYSI